MSAFKKGSRVEYTWPGFGKDDPDHPYTNRGTVVRVGRHGDLTVLWDERPDQKGLRQRGHRQYLGTRNPGLILLTGDDTGPLGGQP